MNPDIFKDHYSILPYHNREHAEGVHNAILKIRDDKLLRISALGHDLLHTGIVLPDDEIRAAEKTIEITKNRGIIKSFDEAKRIENLILGTIFTKRNNLNSDQQLLADADLYAVGANWEEYAKQSARVFIEHCLSQKNMAPTRTEILNFWTAGQDGFFGYLTGITGHEDKPFLTDIANKKLKNFAKNREKLHQIREKNPEILIKIVAEEWKKFFNKPLHIF